MQVAGLLYIPMKLGFYGEWYYSPIYMDYRKSLVKYQGSFCMKKWRSNKYNDHERIKTLSLRGGRIKGENGKEVNKWQVKL